MPREPQSHTFTPRGVLAELFACRDAEVLVAGPAGTGKSMACLEKMHASALVVPGMRGLIVRKTLASLGSTALVTWRERVVKEALMSGVMRFYGGSASESPQYQYRNKSTIVVGGMDKSIRIMSSEYDLIYVQEATELTEDDWEALTTRLRHGYISYQQLMADCNPGPPYHWLKQRANRGSTTMLESRHEDNPTLFDEHGEVTTSGAEYIAKLERLTGVRYLRLRRGIWAAAEGLVYETYDPAVHLIDPFEIPDDWRRWWSIDFGFVHPFVCQFWAEDPDGRLYLYREIYRTKKTVAEHALDIMDCIADRDPDYEHHNEEPRRAHEGRLPAREPMPEAIICDHDAENRAVLDRELGFGTSPAHKAVTEGIQAVQGRLALDAENDGRPRLFIFRDAVVQVDADLADAKKPTSTADEMIGYIWDKGSGKAEKETPLKAEDDGCDAMRYVVAERDLVGEFHLRWM